MTVKVVVVGTSFSALQMLPSALIPAAAVQITAAAHAKWTKLAQEKLNSSRVDYLHGLQPPKVLGPTTFEITLVGALANMIENGADSFQLQETLLSDDTSGWKTSKTGGRYRAIPFWHKTPTAGPVGGTPMGAQYLGMASAVVGPKAAERASLAMGRTIHQKASRLITAMEKAYGKKGRVELPAGLGPKLREHHKTDPFAGMRVLKQRTATGKSQKSFVTFRTIAVDESGQPKPGGTWYHPGIEARHFIKDVAEYVERIGPAIIDGLVKGTLG